MRKIRNAGALIGVLAAVGLLGSWTAEAADAPKAAALCQSCHGVTGNSVKPDVPRLGGQHVEYLRKRLADFHDPGSQDPHAIDAMWGIVEQTDDQTLSDIAQYFAAQSPTPANRAGRPLAEAGRKLYIAGDVANYIPGCASCHGVEGEGAGTVPRLAGQHALYLKNQLERMRLNLRASTVMHPNTNSMSDKQIDELVAYLAGD